MASVSARSLIGPSSVLGPMKTDSREGSFAATRLMSAAPLSVILGASARGRLIPLSPMEERLGGRSLSGRSAESQQVAAEKEK
jgi:hypothetical protein